MQGIKFIANKQGGLRLGRGKTTMSKSHKLPRIQNAFRIERVFDGAMEFARFL